MNEIDPKVYAKQIMDNQMHFRIGLILDAYELANLIDALFTAEESGDWHGQIRWKIMQQLQSHLPCASGRDNGNFAVEVMKELVNHSNLGRQRLITKELAKRSKHAISKIIGEENA